METGDHWISKAILETSKTPFYRLSPSGQVLYVNKAACESLGFTQDEMVGLYPWDFDPDFKPEYWPGVWDRLKKHEIVHIETRHRRKDGTLIDVEVTGHYISNGIDEFSFTFVQDVTARKAAEEATRRERSYLRALIDNFPFMVWLKDKESRFLAVNRVHANSYGYQSPEDLVGKTDFDLSPPDLASHYRKDDIKVIESRQRQVIEEQHEGTQGRHWIETFKAPVVGENGELLGTVGFARDITDRKAAEVELKTTAKVFESQEAMVVTNSDGVILKINDAFSRITGYAAEEAIGKRMNMLSSGAHQQDFYQAMWHSIIEHGGWQGEIWNRRKNGEVYPQWLTITAIKGAGGAVTNYVGTMQDITDRKALEERINYLAHYDALTDLPNRVLLTDRLNLALAQARRERLELCLMYLDLDKFKEVNDTLGHAIGDLLLKEVAGRLLECVRRDTDTVTRMGGDEFVVLLPKIKGKADAIAVAESVLASLNRPLSLQGKYVQISTSIGLAFYPTNNVSGDELIKIADNAMYKAKKDGKNCIRIA